MIVPLVLGFDGVPREVPSLDVLAAVVAISLLSTAVTYILYIRILTGAGASNLLLVTFLIPVSAILLAVTYIEETLTQPVMAGMSFMFCDLACIDGRLRNWLSRMRRTGNQSA